jgi:hypothetical protein
MKGYQGTVFSFRDWVTGEKKLFLDFRLLCRLLCRLLISSSQSRLPMESPTQSFSWTLSTSQPVRLSFVMSYHDCLTNRYSLPLFFLFAERFSWKYPRKQQQSQSLRFHFCFLEEEDQGNRRRLILPSWSSSREDEHSHNVCKFHFPDCYSLRSFSIS